MKLQDKKQISSDFNTQRNQQVLEGVRIAKKIDVLRETLLSLEVQHKKFLESSQKEIIQATKGLIEERDKIQGEINKLEERRKELLKPLDEEWKKLAEAKQEHIAEVDRLVIKDDNLNERESKIEKTEKDNETIRIQLSELKSNAEREAREAKEDRARAKVIRKEVEDGRDAQTKEFATRDSILGAKERENNAWAKALDQREEILNFRKKALDEKERKIKDKYEQLQRTINRLKK